MKNYKINFFSHTFEWWLVLHQHIGTSWKAGVVVLDRMANGAVGWMDPPCRRWAIKYADSFLIGTVVIHIFFTRPPRKKVIYKLSCKFQCEIAKLTWVIYI